MNLRKPNVVPATVLLIAASFVSIGNPVSVIAQNEDGMNPNVRARVEKGAEHPFRPGHWGTLRVDFINLTDKEQQAIAVLAVANARDRQFARMVTLAPRSSRKVEVPIHMPADATGQSVDVNWWIHDAEVADSVITRKFGEDTVRSVPAFLRNTPVMSGWISVDPFLSKESGEVPNVTRTFRQFVMGVENGRLCSELLADDVAATAAVIDPLDQISLSHPDILARPEAIDILRLWTQHGGRLWIPVDLTGAEVVHAIVGDAAVMTEVSRTTLNIVDVDLPAGNAAINKTDPLEFEEPVNFVRAVFDRGQTLATVEGWPAAHVIPFGRGTVIVTTLQPHAWVAANSSDETPRVIPEAERVINELFRPLFPPPITPQQLTTVAEGDVGYSIPPRRMAGSALAVFCGLLLAAGLFLRRIDKAAWLVWVAPVVALVTTAITVVAGGRPGGETPATEIHQRMILAVPGQQLQAVEGTSIAYLPSPQKIPIRIIGDAFVTIPEDTIRDGVHRYYVEDMESALWDRINLSSGLHSFNVSASHVSSRPVQAIAEFTADGLSGRLSIDDKWVPDDGILAGPGPNRVAVQFADRDSFQINAADVLSSAEFVNATLLTEQQNRHSSIYAEIFKSVNPEKPLPSEMQLFPTEPMLLFWTPDESQSVSIGSDMEERTASLVMIPLTLLTPPAGESIRIPSALLPLESVEMPEAVAIPGETDGPIVESMKGGVSTNYNARGRHWLEQPKAGHAMIRFAIPKVCQPFEIEKAQLTIRINAGLRNVELFTGDREKPTRFHEEESMIGVSTIDLDPALASMEMDDGAVYVYLKVSDLLEHKSIVSQFKDDGTDQSDANDIRSDQYWKVEEFSLSLTGHRTVGSPE